MFFILSKTLYYLTMPAVWLLLLAAATVWLRSPAIKKRLKLLLLALLVLFSNPYIINQLMKSWELPPRPLHDLRTYDVGIVLSGIVQTHQQPADRVYMQRGADRLLHALLLYKKGIIKKILITGGNYDKNVTPEAEQLKQVLLLAGVPPQDILVEPHALNTVENARFSAPILQQHFPGGKYLLITSAFHMRRALGCFWQVGIKAEPFPVDFYAVPKQTHWLLWVAPSEQSIALWGLFVHEIIGYIVYDILNYL